MPRTRPVPYISGKSFKLIPLLAHLNSSASVIRISRVVRIVASRLHPEPGHILVTVCQAVLGILGFDCLQFLAATGFCVVTA